MRIIFAADDPLVRNGTYDQEGYTPRERRALARTPSARTVEDQRLGTESTPISEADASASASNHHERNTTMRLFDDDRVGCYLDHIDHRVEKTKDGKEVKMVDLTLRVQPFTPELAVSLDPDVRALLFSMSDATPKPKLKAAHFKLTVPRQQVAISLLPELDEQIVLCDCEVSDVRARTEKGVDGFGLVFYLAYGPASPRELEYVCEWLTQQRFLTFQPQQPALDFAGKDPTEDGVEPARQVPRRGRPRRPVVEAGAELRPGVHAEH
jgi:hypothetical protein